MFAPLIIGKELENDVARKCQHMTSPAIRRVAFWVAPNLSATNGPANGDSHFGSTRTEKPANGYDRFRIRRHVRLAPARTDYGWLPSIDVQV